MPTVDEIAGAQLRRWCWIRGVNDPCYPFDKYPGGPRQQRTDKKLLDKIDALTYIDQDAIDSAARARKRIGKRKANTR